MDDFENPEPKKGEPENKYVARCIPVVKKEHPSWPENKVKAVCYDMYRRHKKNNLEANGYTMFTDELVFEVVKENDTKPQTENKDAPKIENNKIKIVAIIGNRFMNGGFFPNKLLQKVYKQWEGSLHDINHMGTSTGFFLAQTDITYFIGFHKNVQYHKADKSVSMDLIVHEKTKFAEAWKAYIELCEMAGKIPNVSTTYFGKREWVQAKKLPPEADWKSEGYQEDDLVPVLTEVIPVCVSTVMQGKCSDKKGCGIKNTESTCDCGGNSCPTATPNIEVEKKRQELIKKVKELETNLQMED